MSLVFLFNMDHEMESHISDYCSNFDNQTQKITLMCALNAISEWSKSKLSQIDFPAKRFSIPKSIECEDKLCFKYAYDINGKGKICIDHNESADLLFPFVSDDCGTKSLSYTCGTKDDELEIFDTLSNNVLKQYNTIFWNARIKKHGRKYYICPKKAYSYEMLKDNKRCFSDENCINYCNSDDSSISFDNINGHCEQKKMNYMISFTQTTNIFCLFNDSNYGKRFSSVTFVKRNIF